VLPLPASVPPASIVIRLGMIAFDRHRHEVRDQRAIELQVADRQIALPLDVEIDLPAGVQKAGRGVPNLDHAPSGPEHDLAGFRQQGTGQRGLPFWDRAR